MNRGACILIVLSLTVASPAMQAIELLSLTNSVWRYNEGGTNLGYAWIDPYYDDSAWPEGRGVFAHEDAAPIDGLTNTVLSLMGAEGQPVITYYFRTRIVVTNFVAAFSITASNLVDDGAVVYLNGGELYRFNMPHGPVDWQTRAAVSIIGATEGQFVETNFPGGFLVPGTNFLAVEVHQANGGSSDVVFGLELHYSNIIDDPVSPDIVSAVMGTNRSHVLVTFESRIHEAEASDPFNYVIESEFGGDLEVFDATPTNGNQVLLTTSMREDGPIYLLTAKNMLPAGGQALVIDRHRTIGYEIVWDRIEMNGVTSGRAIWKYDQSGREPDPSWREPAFYDATWPSGLGAFAFEDNPALAPFVQTTMSRWVDPCCNTQIVTYYFRTLLPNARAVRSLRLTSMVDDGAIFYWNGSEIHRIRMGAGPVQYDTFATQAVEATIEGPVTMAITNTSPDVNALAVEVHQPSAINNDVFFATELVGIVPSERPPPRLRVRRSGGQLILVWDESGFVLESATTPRGPWEPLPGGGPHTNAADGHAKFFRLRR